MNKEQLHLPKETNKIIPLKPDANLFFNCAIKYLDKKDYHKALRYFERTLEHESDNPVNYFNLAGVLSELGKFEESNQILEQLIDEISPEMYECLYYMANNSANMGDFESAEIFTLKYMESEPDGEYGEEAEELLDFVTSELTHYPNSQDSLNSQLKYDHVKARKMLEEGSFLESIKLIKRILSGHPDFLPALNNLSLAYFYSGKVEKAISTALKVLEQDQSNIHGLCNLAVFYTQTENVKKALGVISTLKKIYPYQADQMFKLATTLGILGEHTTAYKLFVKLHKNPLMRDETLYHYMAVSAFNIQDYSAAGKWWEKTKEFDKESYVAPFYLEFLDRVITKKENWKEILYQYQLPIDKYTDSPDESMPSFGEEIRKNPLIRSSFLWALKNGDKDTKLQVIQAFSYIGDQESEETLRQFLMHPTEEDDLKIAAIFVLKMIGAKEPYHVIIQNRPVLMDSKSLPESLSYWIEKRQLVIECFQTQMKDHYEITEHHEAYKLWMEFISKVYPNGPRIRKEEGWAAAVEYLIAKKFQHMATQKEIARRYGVSPGTVAKNVKFLEEFCK